MEDVLMLIPCSRVLEFKSKEVIYHETQAQRDVYLVIAGMVKISRVSPGQREMSLDIYTTDDFFGLSAFVGSGSERATAMRAVQVMKWSAAEIEEYVARDPRLGLALLQMVIQRSSRFEDRVKSYSLETMPYRLARCLIYLSERFGTVTRDGAIQMAPFTHATLAEFMGTSRTMVTKCMSFLRRRGYVEDSRRRIVLYSEPLNRWLGGTPQTPAGLDPPRAPPRATEKWSSATSPGGRSPSPSRPTSGWISSPKRVTAC